MSYIVVVLLDLIGVLQICNHYRKTTSIPCSNCNNNYIIEYIELKVHEPISTRFLPSRY